ncbi:hypothetical protein PanWU01x14_160760 [Parasponia andersonii]|uniref:Retrotransposon Copia-like N-terminal domain-containing protein n=1 Tax=Parasponia andersonii TaxID=3476 RepID=A0A2P5CE89_PARAD|nr:hypothetical protein PanWU01x14_160760 [Parasponia andersonii]
MFIIFPTILKLYFFLLAMEAKSTLSTIKTMNQDFVWLDRFDGTNFTQWQGKVKFLLTTLKIFYVLDPNLAPILPPSDKDIMLPRLKDSSVKRMNSYVVVISSTHFLIVSTIFTPTSNSTERFGMHLNSNIRQRRKKYFRIKEESRKRDKNNNFHSYDGESNTNAMSKLN